MGTTKISPLPYDLRSWSEENVKQAKAERRQRVDELLKVPTGEADRAHLDEFRSINDDMERLKDWSPINPHPGFPTQGRTAATTYSPESGHVRGLGEAFLKNLGAGSDGLKVLDGTSGGSMVPPFFDPQIRLLPQRQMFVRSVIPTTAVSSDKVDYLRQSVLTNNAAPVAAGALKPSSTFTVEKIETQVRTIAHVTEAIDRHLLMDFGQLADFLDGQLRLGVLLAEENQIVNGDGTGVNLLGILNTPSIQTQAKGADPVPDAVYKAITKVRAVFAEPDAIVFHPNDWQDIRLLRTADGEYIASTIVEADPDRLWGKQVITTPVIAEGTGLVGAFAQASQIWDREQARVTFTESGLGDAGGQELFTRNQLRYRGESRIAFGVSRPAFFCTVTGI